MKHRILLLGMGFWGSLWLKNILSNSRCTLAGVAGSEDELEKACAEHGISPALTFTDFREAIANTEADIAVVVLPGVLHFEADKLALEKGMHVITEKPLAMDIEQAEALLALKAQHPKQKFMACQNYRWRPHNQAIKQAIDAGMIGKVESVLLEFRQQEDLQGYRAGLEMPLLQDVCIHHFDLIRFFTGANCREVYCRTWRPSWSIFKGKPNTEAVLQMENGATVCYNGSWAARGRESSWDGNFTITGEKGCLTLDADDRVFFYEHKKAAAVVLDMQKQEGVELEKPAMEHTEMAYGFQMFMDCIEQDTTPETTLEDNFKSYAMVAAGLESVQTGQPASCR